MVVISAQLMCCHAVSCTAPVQNHQPAFTKYRFQVAPAEISVLWVWDGSPERAVLRASSDGSEGQSGLGATEGLDSER